MDSFLSWIGGKKLLRKRLLQEFPEDFETYVEVFGGAAWLLFAKDRHAKFEIYNDYNKELVNLFKCVKYHTQELQRQLDFMLNSRQMFEENLKDLNSAALTDIQRAARYFMCIKLSYGSTIDSYGAVKKDTVSMREYLTKAEERLRSVVIENRSYEQIIKKYDKKSTLFYLDPPYYKAERYYTADFKTQDHVNLAQIVKTINAKVIVSYNDDEFIKHLYKDLKIIEVDRNNNLKSRYTGNKRYKELIIKNF